MRGVAVAAGVALAAVTCGSSSSTDVRAGAGARTATFTTPAGTSISGNLSEREAKDLAAVLRAGTLPVGVNRTRG